MRTAYCVQRLSLTQYAQRRTQYEKNDMKLYPIKEMLLYILARILMFIFCLMPLGLALWIARMMGRCAYYIDAKHRSIAYSNLKRAFSKTKSQEEIKNILKGYFINQYQDFIEVLRLSKFNKEYIERYIDVQGKENVFDALKAKKGLIFLGLHLGNWEFSNVLCSNMGFEYCFFAQEQPMGLLDKLLNDLRRSKGCKMQFVGTNMKNVIHALKDNICLGMVVDHGSEGILIDFLGTRARTPTGAVRLALKYNCPLVTGYIKRKKGPYHELRFFPPLDLQNTGSLEDDLKDNLERINKIVGKFADQFAEDYFWSFKRWKYSDEKKVLILSDCKAGHVRQSEAVLKAISNLGYRVTSNILEISYKSRYRQFILALCSLFNGRYCNGCLSCVRFCLKRESFQKLEREFADIIISCGSKLAPVNLYLKREYNARSICIMKPSSNLKDFDLCIIPRHDNPPKRDNVLSIDGSINLINQDYLNTHGTALAELIKNKGKSLENNILGLFVGGDTKNFYLDKNSFHELMQELKRICKDLKLSLLITTSRRTSKLIEELLKSNFANDSNCTLLIIANEQNYPFVIGGILSLSKIVMVSSESISMVSEAASSGRHVLSFHLKKKKTFFNKETRHEKFIKDLVYRGIIQEVQPNTIREEISKLLESKQEPQRLDNFSLLQETLRKII